MSKEYSKQLDELLQLYVQKADLASFMKYANKLKGELSIQSFELRRAMSVLDSLVNLYAPNEDWITGFILEHQSEFPVRKDIKLRWKTRSTQSEQPQVSVKFSKEQIRELAHTCANTNGEIETAEVIKQMKSKGDPREDSDIAKQVGNLLYQDGWERTGKGKYRLKKEV